MLLPRERHKAAYQAALVQRFRHLPEVKRIERHRHLPAALYKARRCPVGYWHMLCIPATPVLCDGSITSMLMNKPSVFLAIAVEGCVRHTILLTVVHADDSW